ncbi:choice-of-anchor I family protein [Cohnella silvisoli]|uniref:Choice-of-anchor I family protein n=1 Tax=Cohnella silvisoli TaxID=2873699 RepID=A0ABV1KTB2_9BACL|nr:choice-of-anchor I family protein [Cohnella silvisoli]MCD9022924.1 choice-of-anchor I family protein [Cohnella silvisoli]
MNNFSKKSMSLLLSAAVLVGTVFSGSVATAGPIVVPGTPYDSNGVYDVTVPHVIINQVYGYGYVTDAGLISNGFIELYNPTNADVDLSGWSLHYADRGDTSSVTDSTYQYTAPLGSWEQLNLTGTIKAQSSYLITGKFTGATTPMLDLSVSDQHWDRVIANKGMKVALMSNQAALNMANPYSTNPAQLPAGYVDMIGTGSNDPGSTVDAYEGTGGLYPSGSSTGTSKKKAIRRNVVGGKVIDTDNNVNDFKQVAYDPYNAATYEAMKPRSGVIGITNTALANAIVGSAYTGNITISGGTPPYNYSSITLPAGLTLNAVTGAITGIPAVGTEGTVSVEFSVTDNSYTPLNVKKTLALTVTAAPMVLSATALSLPNTTVGVAYTPVPSVNVTGGTAPYTYAATGLPSGLTINATTGEISGTPTQGRAGTVQVVITVTDNAAPVKATITKTLPLTVSPAIINYVDTLNVSKIGSYSVGSTNADGGVAEIVKYNKDNGKFYLVVGSGTPPTLDVVTLSANLNMTKEKSIYVKTLSESGGGFAYGDLTSVDINTTTKRIYTSIQEADYTKAGKILVMDYDGNLITTYAAGIQPDMIKTTSDGRYILTADEGEPRGGSGSGIVDPEGSITIVDTINQSVSRAKFNNEAVIDNDVHIRGASGPDGKITGSGSKADALFDFEPEYIALSADNTKAYVSLQENNAVATVDIASKTITSVKSLGFKDFNDPKNVLDLIKESTPKIKLENVPFKGLYMPDGIAAHSIGGKTYLFTANEGDATEWPVIKPLTRTSTTTIKDIKGSLTLNSEAEVFLRDKGTTYDKVEVLNDMGKDSIYMYGGRSFSIWDADTLTQVYDSGSDFERITALRLPAYFNAGHNNKDLDSRSGKKGPEPEDIKTGKVGNKTFAFVGLERIGGVMTYDVSNPAAPTFANYTNTRDFTVTDVLNTDTGPEGLEFIPAADSPTGLPLLLVAYEVGGRVAVLQLNVTKVVLDKKSLSIKVGDAAMKITPAVTPVGGGAATVTWSSSNPAVATVDAGGNVTPVAVGTATIMALSADGYGEAQATVTVGAASTNIGNIGNTGNNGSAGGTETPKAPVITGDETKVTAEAKATTDASGKAEATFTAKQVTESLDALSKAASNGKPAVLEFKATVTGDATQAVVRVPAESLAKIAGSGVSAVTVDAGVGSVSLDKTALSTVSAAASKGDVSVTIKKTDAATVTRDFPQASKDAIAAAVGSKPVFDFTVTADGKTVSTFGGGSVDVTVPYTLSAGEDIHAIVIYYISDAGEIAMVPNCIYDAATGKVNFSVKHFSKYAVGYNKLAFSDTSSSFAKDYITYLSARNIIGGIGDNKFAPKDLMTRADITVILARMADADLSKYATSSFVDVDSSAYYFRTVEWAVNNGIADGIGNGMFNPKAHVTREQLVTMIARYASVMKISLPQKAAIVTFVDHDKVSEYAIGALSSVQQAGIIGGKTSIGQSGMFFAPKDYSTRAETAKILAILMQVMIK